MLEMFCRKNYSVHSYFDKIILSSEHVSFSKMSWILYKPTVSNFNIVREMFHLYFQFFYSPSLNALNISPNIPLMVIRHFVFFCSLLYIIVFPKIGE